MSEPLPGGGSLAGQALPSDAVIVDIGRLRAAGRHLNSEAFTTLMPVWDRLSRVWVPADPRAAEAPGADVAGGLSAAVDEIAERIRLSLVHLQGLGDALIRAAQDYEQSDREAQRQYRGTLPPPARDPRAHDGDESAAKDDA
ncbi:MAG: hypothetical protein HOV79_17890 [Hamadaea sp.]|nr:hypothetical protein [Hamadaea sp.]